MSHDFRRVQLLVVAAVLTALFLASSVAQPVGTSAAPGREPAVAVVSPAKAAPAANWTWQGCWTQFSAGTCRDIYRDQQGGYWICRECGSTGNPGPGKCSQISSQTLSTGFWCS